MYKKQVFSIFNSYYLSTLFPADLFNKVIQKSQHVVIEPPLTQQAWRKTLAEWVI